MTMKEQPPARLAQRHQQPQSSADLQRIMYDPEEHAIHRLPLRVEHCQACRAKDAHNGSAIFADPFFSDSSTMSLGTYYKRPPNCVTRAGGISLAFTYDLKIIDQKRSVYLMQSHASILLYQANRISPLPLGYKDFRSILNVTSCFTQQYCSMSGDSSSEESQYAATEYARTEPAERTDNRPLVLESMADVEALLVHDARDDPGQRQIGWRIRP